MPRRLIVALVLVAVACQATAILLPCDPNATPATPQKVRVESQKWSSAKQRTEVAIAFDNPTTSKTGCITSYKVSIADEKGTSLGAKVSLKTATTNPIVYTANLNAGKKYTIRSVEVATTAGKKASATPNLTFIANGPPSIDPRSGH